LSEANCSAFLQLHSSRKNLSIAAHEYHCAVLFANVEAPQQLATKGVNNRMKLLKALMIVGVLAGALTLGACQNKSAAVTTSTAPAYHK
jgi:hypothetical protein